MRVAANEVERTLELANNEISIRRKAGEFDNDIGSPGADRSDLVEAFKRAAEYRDRPLRQVMLPGLKSGMKQPVTMTNITKIHGRNDYVECLVAGHPQWIRKSRLEQAA